MKRHQPSWKARSWFYLKIDAARLTFITGIPVLELYLLVSIRRILEKEIGQFTFEMVYDEYRDCMRKLEQVSELYSKPVALKVWSTSYFVNNRVNGTQGIRTFNLARNHRIRSGRWPQQSPTPIPDDEAPRRCSRARARAPSQRRFADRYKAVGDQMVACVLYVLCDPSWGHKNADVNSTVTFRSINTTNNQNS